MDKAGGNKLINFDNIVPLFQTVPFGKRNRIGRGFFRKDLCLFIILSRKSLMRRKTCGAVWFSF